MKLIILFGDFGVGKTYIANLIKSINNHNNILTINIYDFISYRIFKLVNVKILESNPYLEYITYNNLFKFYPIKSFIKSEIYDEYKNLDLKDIFKKFLNKINANYDIDQPKYEIIHTPEFYASEEFKKFIFENTRNFTEYLRNNKIQHNAIEYLLSYDFAFLLSQGYRILDYLIFYGYSIKEYEYFSNKYSENLVFVENASQSHYFMINDENKKNVIMSKEQLRKKDIIKSNVKKIIYNNLDFTSDLINKINITISNIKNI